MLCAITDTIKPSLHTARSRHTHIHRDTLTHTHTHNPTPCCVPLPTPLNPHFTHIHIYSPLRQIADLPHQTDKSRIHAHFSSPRNPHSLPRDFQLCINRTVARQTEFLQTETFLKLINFFIPFLAACSHACLGLFSSCKKAPPTVESTVQPCSSYSTLWH